SARVFHHLRNAHPGAGGEIQLTDGIAGLLTEERVLAYTFEGRRYDCGTKLGYLEATVDYGLKHAEVGEGFSRFMADKKIQRRAFPPQGRPKTGITPPQGAAQRRSRKRGGR